MRVIDPRAPALDGAPVDLKGGTTLERAAGQDTDSGRLIAVHACRAPGLLRSSIQQHLEGSVRLPELDGETRTAEAGEAHAEADVGAARAPGAP